MSGLLVQPVIRGARFFLAHAPGLVRYGSKPARDIAANAAIKGKSAAEAVMEGQGVAEAVMEGKSAAEGASQGRASQGGALEEKIAAALRDYPAALAYPPNQVMLGNLHPDALNDLPRPWYDIMPGAETAGERRGPHGELMPEGEFFAWLKICDAAGLVRLEAAFTEQMREALSAHALIGEQDLARLGEGGGGQESVFAALPLLLGDGRRVGSIRADHGQDETLSAQVLLENLTCKATAVMALRDLLAAEGVAPGEVGYLLNSGEEAVGDRYQRGGGNLAKAVAEMSGCFAATGVDIKGFCCGPVHAIHIAAGLVRAGMYKHIAVVGGCSLAKLGMKYQGHLKHGQPILEDILVGAAVLVSGDDGRSPLLRLDGVGRHTVGAGSSQQAILEALVAEPLQGLGLSFADIDKYATELHNPELTEPAGSGDVPLLNYRTIAGLAALHKEITAAEIPAFVAARGMPGFSPTQGHIASALPFLAHAVDGLRDDGPRGDNPHDSKPRGGGLGRVMLLAKGSLFLGRMTQMADGMSLILERNGGA